MSLPQVKNSHGFCNTVYNASADAVNWLGRNTKAAGVAVWQTTQKVASAVARFFVQAGGFIKFYTLYAYNAVKSNYLANRSIYHAAGIGLVVGSIVTAIICRLCNKSARAEAAAAAQQAEADVFMQAEADGQNLSAQVSGPAVRLEVSSDEAGVHADVQSQSGDGVSIDIHNAPLEFDPNARPLARTGLLDTSASV